MKRASAPRFDLFKTVVTVILAGILVLMLLRGCAANPASPTPGEVVAAQNPTQTLTSAQASTEASAVVEATQTFTASAAPTAVEPTVTPTTVAPTTTPEAATPQATSTISAEGAATPAQSVSCNTRVPSRLSVGQSALVLLRLNMRREPSIDAAILQTNPTNTQVEIIGGPVCTPVGDRAYLWWQIRLTGGAEGWSAESPLNEASYFLEPIP